MSVTQPFRVTRLIPFNPHRFDACAAYLAQQYGRPLTIFELVKHHVMTDVFHVLQTGHQAIGGELEPWPWGPVNERAYKRLKHWEHCHEETQEQPAEYELTKADLYGFSPRASFDLDDTSPAELRAMNNAIGLLSGKSFQESYDFFHGNDTFMGRAYNAAKAEGRALAWDDILDAHDALHGTDHQHIKRRLITYG